jgi:anti-sigma factor RsiW
MNHEEQLKLQAYLDGELSSREARQFAEYLAQEPAAQELLAELRQTKSVLSAHDPELKVPQSREFYWAQIERGLRTVESRPPAAQWQSLLAWLKWLAPIGAAALLVFWLELFPSSSGTPRPFVIENTAAEASCITFHSDAEGISVVWVDTSGI